jgi:hypothetical protein
MGDTTSPAVGSDPSIATGGESDEVVKEVAVYLVKPASLPSLGALSLAMNAFLASRPGYLRRTMHQDLKLTNKFMDIVEWRSLEDALAAAQLVEQGSVPGFLEAIEEVVSMDHFRVSTGS